MLLKFKLSLNQFIIFSIGIVFLILQLCLTNKVFFRLSYELQNPMTYDAVLYWVVGKGYSYGNSLYSGYYENKPPMVFFLMSLSYSLFGNYHLSNVVCYLCLLIIGFSPSLFVIIKTLKTENRSITSLILSLIIAYPCGILLMLYTQIRSGEAQVENFGAAFIIIYLLIIYLLDSKNKKWYSPSLIVSGLFLMIGVMFKEPFALVGLVTAILFCRSLRDVLYKIIIPFSYGGLMGLLLLICTNSLVPYLTIYIANMFQNHIGTYGSPFDRGKNFLRLFDDLSKFSQILPFIIVCLALGSFAIVIYQITKQQKKAIFKSISIVVIALVFWLSFYCVSFSVGLGGQYYNHHFVFAIPLYFGYLLIVSEAILSLRIEKKLNSQNVALPLIALLTTIIGGSSASHGIYELPEYTYNEHVLSREEVMIENAQYIDTILKIYNCDTYQYLGFNGFLFLGHTTHLPKGPIFVQDPNNFHDPESFFSTSLKQQITEVDIIVKNIINAGVLNEWINNYVNENFIAFNYKNYNLNQPKELNATVLIRKSIQKQ